MDNRGYFAVEQLSASAVIFGAMGLIWLGRAVAGAGPTRAS